jgi:DNA-binding FadR family transcriptional regulator
MVSRKKAEGAREGAAADPKDQGRAYLRVADSIRLRILANDLKPGDRLPSENDLAREEGVGRTTVREALRLLASVGLIETKRGVRGGAFVTYPSADDLYDQMTTALSLMTQHGEMGDGALDEAIAFTMPMVARIASQRGTEAEVAHLLTLPDALLETASDAEWMATAREFSTLLIHMARNHVLSMILKPLMTIASTRYTEDRNLPGWREATAACYRDVAEAVRRRAPAASEEAMLRLRQQYVPPHRAGAGRPSKRGEG